MWSPLRSTGRLLARLVYQAAYVCLLLLSAPVLWARRGVGHYLRTLPGRATFDLPEPVEGVADEADDRLWIHAVSVGEVMVAATFLRALDAAWERAGRPPLPVVVTTVTPTGQDLARRTLGQGDAPRATVAYLPFDLGPAIRRFHRRYRPTRLILSEGDYWPLLLADARRRGLPVAVVNGRSSDRAFRRQRRLGLWNDLFYAPVGFFGVQTETDAERLAELGVDRSEITVTGNLKFDAPPPEPKPELEAAVRRLAGGRPILVAGSTMEGEDAPVLDAFRTVDRGLRRDGEGGVLLVLAPRHPERWDDVARLVEEKRFDLLRRSEASLDSAPSGAEGDADRDSEAKPEVVLLDSLGELARVYSLGWASFIGGTLVDTGGHNPLEPAQFGVPTAVGPSMHNFRQMAEIFDRRDAWGRVADGDALAALWLRWLREPDAGREVGERARRLLEENRGAAARSVEMLGLGEDPAEDRETRS